MTRFLPALLLITGLMLLNQCKKDEEARVRVTIKDSDGHPVSAITVYMFDAPSSENVVHDPTRAVYSTISDNEGVATFLLGDVFGAEPIYRQTLLYFMVFNAESQVVGKIQLLLTEGKSAYGTMILSAGYTNISSP
jgi:hypothetical protein